MLEKNSFSKILFLIQYEELIGSRETHIYKDKHYVDHIFHLPFSADKAPQLVTYVAPWAQRGVDVDGSRQVWAIVHYQKT